VIKSAFGLTVQRPGGWLADQAKSFFVADIWYVPFVVLVYAAMRRFRRSWWLISAGAVGLATIAWYSLAPHLVEPLFYRITAIRSEALRSHLDPLLQKAGLDPAVLYEAESGKKTKEVNAYLSGLFLGKRIVLYDLLAKEADRSELEFVVAHEIAHWKKNHTMKGIGLGTVGAAGVFLLLGGLLKLTAGKRRQGDDRRYGPESLPIFFFWLNVILLLVMPVECAVSRRFERRADAYALELTQDPERAIRLFQKVARKNLSDLNPPPLARFWLYTHPPIVERIEMALKQATKPDGPISGPEAPAPPEKPATIPEADKPGPEIGTTHEDDGSGKGEGKSGKDD
jgi:STE24 endopeptidase